MSAQRTPDWLVERIALGELPPEKLKTAREALLREPDGAERLAALEASSRDALSAHPPEQVITEVRRRAAGLDRTAAARRSLSRSAARWGGPILVLAAALVLFVARPPVQDGGDEDRPKGLSPQLVLHRQAEGQARRLGPGAVARPGDTLQLSYVAAGQPFGVVLSLDGAGAVTLHLPDDAGGAAAALRTEGTVALPSSFELDAAPGFERFFLITASHPFDVEPVLRAASLLAKDGDRAQGAPLSLPAGLQQTSFLVRKEFVQ